MPPLKNIKHEKFARAVIECPTQTEAYVKTYDPEGKRLSNPNSAKDHASNLVAKSSIRNRIAELLDAQGLTLQRFNSKLNDLLDAKSEDVQFKSTRLGYELHGVLDREKNNGESSKDIMIQVNIMGSNGENSTVTI